MAKKRATQGKRTLTGKQRNETLTEQQRLRRAELKVQRIEAQLYGKTSRDGVISDRLDKLGRGERGEYIKQALYEKIAREISPPEHPDMGAILDELQALRAQLNGFRARAAAVVEIGFDDPSPVEQSSGIDTSRPRPRKKITTAQPAQIEAPEPVELTEADSIRLAGMMAESIRVAQPGKH